MENNFLGSILVDPLSKSKLLKDNNKLISDYGRTYKYVNGFPDLRILANKISADSKKWNEGQEEYEVWNKESYLNWNISNLQTEKQLNSEMYEDIEFIDKNILDVGGNAGLFREFANGYRNFVILDPYHGAIDDARRSHSLVTVYPFLAEPVDFVIGLAEHLPFKSNTFDIVHMRSVIDHFLNPELALLEAYRVLNSNGVLIIGVSLEKIDISMASKMKKIVKKLLRENKDHDHHSWHPTIENLRSLCEIAGFRIYRERFQNVPTTEILYIYAEKLN